jgi:hypothetical protein
MPRSCVTGQPLWVDRSSTCASYIAELVGSISVTTVHILPMSGPMQCKLQHTQVVPDSFLALWVVLNFPARSAHEICVVEKCGLGAIRYTKVDEVRQDPQDGFGLLRRTRMEERAERQVIWDIVCASSHYRRQTDESPGPHIFSFPTFTYAMWRILLSTWMAWVSIRKRSTVEAFICGSRSCITTYHSERSASVIQAVWGLRHICVQFKLECTATTLVGLEGTAIMYRVAYTRLWKQVAIHLAWSMGNKPCPLRRLIRMLLRSDRRQRSVNLAKGLLGSIAGAMPQWLIHPVPLGCEACRGIASYIWRPHLPGPIHLLFYVHVGQ